jgi:hypothetical protein
MACGGDLCPSKYNRSLVCFRWSGSLISHTQDTLRAVMRVEMSIDEDFAAPTAAKGLSDEVKVVRDWLGPSDLFGPPGLLIELPVSDAKSSEAVPPAVAEVVEEIVVQEDSGEVTPVVVSFFFSAWFACTG